jgi:UDP-glucose 4-epimerase
MPKPTDCVPWRCADGSLGEAHRPETHLIPLAIEAALGLRPHLRIFGDDYPTPDGTGIRDYVHVGDLALAHWRALEWLETADGFNGFNLGTGTGYSVRQVIDAVERASGRTVPTDMSVRRSGDAAILVADPTKASDLLSWRPAVPGLDAIVKTAWRWHSEVMPRTIGLFETMPE